MSNIYVFSSKFDNEEGAMAFCKTFYSSNDNGKCKLWEAVGFQTDHDFVETIFGDLRFDYLQKMIGDCCGLVKKYLNDDDNTFILIYDSEGNADFIPNKVNGLNYCGKYKNIDWH